MTEQTAGTEHLAGALAGWRRSDTDHGIVLTLQVAERVEDVRDHRFGVVDLALNERQLRSLARDLVRAAEERHIQVFAHRPWWKGVFDRPDRSIG